MKSFLIISLFVGITTTGKLYISKNSSDSVTAVPVQPGAVAAPPPINRYPTYSQPVYTTNPISSSNNTRAAAGGFALGVAVDELFHHSHNHSSFFDNNNSNDFGGGDFGVSDFGGNGGDSSFS